MLYEASSNVVVAVAELNVLGDSDTVLCNFWRAKSSVENDIATTWSKSDLDSVSKHVASLKHEGARLSSEFDLLTGEVAALCSHKLGSGTIKDSFLESSFESRLHHFVSVGVVRIIPGIK